MDKAKRDERNANQKDGSGTDETFGNREESMSGSASGELGKQRSASSGTTPLSGESSDSNEKTAPGGVEGASGNS